MNRWSRCSPFRRFAVVFGSSCGVTAQLGFQVADILAVTAYSFVVTYCLVALIDCIPGLEVLATDEVIVQGIDAAYNVRVVTCVFIHLIVSR